MRRFGPRVCLSAIFLFRRERGRLSRSDKDFAARASGDAALRGMNFSFGELTVESTFCAVFDDYLLRLNVFFIAFDGNMYVVDK